uniref:Uncharacterized protein n=1 Tax=Klebsiella phage HenuGS TaxID=3350566 RepID=A0AB74UKW5_9CAUD
MWHTVSLSAPALGPSTLQYYQTLYSFYLLLTVHARTHFSFRWEGYLTNDTVVRPELVDTLRCILHAMLNQQARLTSNLRVGAVQVQCIVYVRNQAHLIVEPVTGQECAQDHTGRHCHQEECFPLTPVVSHLSFLVVHYLLLTLPGHNFLPLLFLTETVAGTGWAGPRPNAVDSVAAVVSLLPVHAPLRTGTFYLFLDNGAEANCLREQRSLVVQESLCKFHRTSSSKRNPLSRSAILGCKARSLNTCTHCLPKRMQLVLLVVAALIYFFIR